MKSDFQYLRNAARIMVREGLIDTTLCSILFVWALKSEELKDIDEQKEKQVDDSQYSTLICEHCKSEYPEDDYCSCPDGRNTSTDDSQLGRDGYTIPAVYDPGVNPFKKED